ncbi:MAG: DUF3581 family protein [Pseudomonadota bacterium]
MKLQDFFSLDGETLRFSREQSSNFAKQVAGDFNPIHNVDAKRFCVPGDLLFAVFLHRYGVRESMQFSFSGMVDENDELVVPSEIGDAFTLADVNGKTYLDVVATGKPCRDAGFVQSLTEQYVQFSGQTFPHILVKLMRDNNVMINPDRPLVIYKSMMIELQDFPATTPVLEFAESSLNVEGKKGEAQLRFSIRAHGEIIGRGEKSMLMSGLRDYEQSEIDRIVAQYETWKADFQAVGA